MLTTSTRKARNCRFVKAVLSGVSPIKIRARKEGELRVKISTCRSQGLCSTYQLGDDLFGTFCKRNIPVVADVADSGTNIEHLKCRYFELELITDMNGSDDGSTISIIRRMTDTSSLLPKFFWKNLHAPFLPKSDEGIFPGTKWASESQTRFVAITVILGG